MGRQVNFFVDQNDRAWLMQRVESHGGKLVFERFHSSEELSFLDPQSIQMPLPPGRSVLFVPQNAPLQSITLRPAEYAGYSWVVADDLSPVIEFWPSVESKSVLTRGRIYTRVARNNPYYKDVIRLFTSLSGPIKKWKAVVPDGYRVGPSVLERVKQGTLRLMEGSLVYAICD